MKPHNRIKTLAKLLQLLMCPFELLSMRMLCLLVAVFGAPGSPATPAPTILPTRSPTTLSPTTSAPTNARSTQNSIYTVMGYGSGSSSTGTAAEMNSPRGVYEDSAGMLYVVETAGHCIRKFSLSVGIVMVYAGSCGSGLHTGDNGPASNAKMATPLGITADSLGNIYVTELVHYIRKISTNGIITTFAGTGACSGAISSSQATAANLCNPAGIAVNSGGVLYYSNYGSYQIGLIYTTGLVAVLAGMIQSFRFFFTHFEL